MAETEVDFTSMSINELWALREDIGNILAVRINKEKVKR